MRKYVFCLDNEKEYYYSTDDSKKAIEYHLEYLNNKALDRNSKIIDTGKCYTFIHNGLTYSIIK